MSKIINKLCNLTVCLTPVSVVIVGKRNRNKIRSLSLVTMGEFTQELHKVCTFIKNEANIQIQDLWDSDAVIDYNDKFFYGNVIRSNVTFHGNKPSVAPTRSLYLASEIGYQLYKGIYLRRKLCQFLANNSWNASYVETNDYYHSIVHPDVIKDGKVIYRAPKLDINLYRNLMRAKTLPKMPQLTNKVDIRYASSKIEHCSALQSVSGTKDLYECEISLYDMRCIVRFQLPAYILPNLSTNVKLTRPWLHYDGTQKNPFSWYTVLQYQVPVDIDIKNRILCYDLGIKKYCTISIVNQNGRYSTEIQPSNECLHLDGKIRRLIEEKDQLGKKIKQLNLQSLFVYKKRPNDPLLLRFQQKITILTENRAFIAKKIIRLKKARAFVLARDLRKICKKQHITTIATENLKWVHNGGRWQQGLDNFCVEHVCVKNGIHFRTVSATNNSQSCPKCRSKIAYNSRNRTSKCKKCSYTQDRDYMASLMLSVKYYNKVIGNNQVLLSKYPNKIVKSTIIV